MTDLEAQAELQITDSLQINGILLTTYIQKALDHVNHFFLISVLKWYGFEDDLIKWIKALLENQESCVSKDGKTACYFKLVKGIAQGHLISAYFLFLVFEVAFTLIKTSNNIEGLNIFNHNFLYNAYADMQLFL